jgi:hypothetical protein
MTYRIQKTIINKFLDLVDKPSTNEQEITELLGAIEKLYTNRILTESDIFRQKIELIGTKLSKDLETIKRKRSSKEISIELSRDIYQIFKADLEGVDYSKSELTDLDKFENEKGLSISFENVITVLENLVVLKRRLSSEADLERFIAVQLAYVFGKEKVSTQYSVGGFLALKTDIDIGNGQVGIELKVADNLGATDMQRLIGQVIYYRKRFYNNNLLVFIAGRNSISSHLTELKGFIEELGIKVIYCQAVNE